ncbi:hypothetical protein [Luteitalea sp. TBR-22]|uniref:hypothetical protein n=1 Tax=Luteitalea sp. TBR-22 TaxID=2802971 RepID=UPI001EF55163|nr:hypothetical protein [Luteitalea sp. TBR-22]
MISLPWHDLPLRALLVTAALWPGAAGLAPLTEAQSYAVTGGRAVVICPLRSGGRLEGRTQTVRGLVALLPGAREVAGTLVADVRDLEAGSAMATSQVRENLLEVYRGDGYASITLGDLVLDVPVQAANRQGAFRGQLTVHGQARAVTGTYALRHRGRALDLQLSLDLRLDDYGMAPPSHPALRVTGTMQYALKVTLQPTSAP